MIRASLFRRLLSSTVQELGPKLPTSSFKVQQANSKFFKLEKLEKFEDVLQAPEGSVVVVNPEVPTEFQIRTLIYFAFISWLVFFLFTFD